jgi:hypothetical protein
MASHESINNPTPEASKPIATAPTNFVTYRFSKLPFPLTEEDLLRCFTEADQKNVLKLSLTRSLGAYSASTATVTFRGKPSFAANLVHGEGVLSPNHGPALEDILVDDAFYGLTPLNNVNGEAQAK